MEEPVKAIDASISDAVTKNVYSLELRADAHGFTATLGDWDIVLDVSNHRINIYTVPANQDISNDDPMVSLPVHPEAFQTDWGEKITLSSLQRDLRNGRTYTFAVQSPSLASAICKAVLGQSGPPWEEHGIFRWSLEQEDDGSRVLTVEATAQNLHNLLYRLSRVVYPSLEDGDRTRVRGFVEHTVQVVRAQSIQAAIDAGLTPDDEVKGDTE